MKSASVYKIKDNYVFCSEAETKNKLGLSIPPYIHLPQTATAKEIVNAIEMVFDANQFNVPTPNPNEWDYLSKNI